MVYFRGNVHKNLPTLYIIQGKHRSRVLGTFLTTIAASGFAIRVAVYVIPLFCVPQPFLALAVNNVPKGTN